MRKLPINKPEYLKMFRTTASRILVSAFMDNSPEQDADPETQEKQAIKGAKAFCDDVSNPLLQTETNQPNEQ